jgi:hypothetical protein
MAASLLGLGLALAAGPAAAESNPLSAPAPPPSLFPVPANQVPGIPGTPAGPPPQVIHFAPSTQAVSATSTAVWQTSKPGKPPFPAFQPVAMQAPVPPRRSQEESVGYGVQTETPGPSLLFRLESERDLKERLRQEARQVSSTLPVIFPEEPILTREKYTPRRLPAAVEIAEPHYVCYGRLLFEQINSERYDWDLGIIHPLVAAGQFYWDIITLPYHLATRPCEHYECSAGYCLPGDPVPLYCYPPEFTQTATVAEAAVVAALFFAFP